MVISSIQLMLKCKLYNSQCKMKDLLVLFLFIVTVSAESCIQCNSNDYPQCATQPQNMMAKTCPFLNSTCYTRILSGFTRRGCSSELNSTTIMNCYMNRTCQTCNRTACNNEIFPQSRPSCYQCDNSTSSACTLSSYSPPLPCPIYREDDQCYIYQSLNTRQFKRGCLSSAENTCRNISQCYVCSGHGCNDLPANSTVIPNANHATRRAINSSLLIFAVGIFLFKLY